MKKCLTNANIITHEGEILLNMDILINDTVIEAVGINLNKQDTEVIDMNGKFISPGLTALHTHSPMNIFKGIAEDVNIDDWLNRELWPYESKMQDNDVYWGAKLACAEMINNGITAFADHYFKSDIIAKACKECGIKADIAYTIFGFGGNCDEELALATEFVQSHQHEELIRPRLGPHSTYICSKEVLKKIINRAHELNCGIHIHMSETSRQVEESRQQYNGQTPFDVLAECGGFNLDCIAAHSLWIEESDLKYLNENCCVPISPKTYLKLGMGKGNLWKFGSKMNLVSGNDGSASSNSIDVIEQIRLYALLGKWEDQAEDYTLKDMWKILMDGHKHLSFNSGKIEPGYCADFTVFDLSKVSTAPVYNPLAAILYSSQPSEIISDTVINGRFVKRDGKLMLDENEIIENASQCAKEIYQRGKGQSKIYF